MRGLRTTVAILIAVSTAAIFGVSGLGATADESGGTLEFLAGELVDKQGQTIAEFELTAAEYPVEGHIGDMGFAFNGVGPGEGISACSIEDPEDGPDTTTPPLAEVVCGASHQVAVEVQGCTAVIETHGLVHADYPYTIYIGPATIDIDLRFDPNTASGELTVEMYTPKDVIRIKGTTIGEGGISTCG